MHRCTQHVFQSLMLRCAPTCMCPAPSAPLYPDMCQAHNAPLHPDMSQAHALAQIRTSNWDSLLRFLEAVKAADLLALIICVHLVNTGICVPPGQHRQARPGVKEPTSKQG